MSKLAAYVQATGQVFFFPVTSLFSTENINSACVRVVISCGPRCLYTVAFYRDRGAGTFDRHWVLHPEKAATSPPYRFISRMAEHKCPLCQSCTLQYWFI